MRHLSAQFPGLKLEAFVERKTDAAAPGVSGHHAPSARWKNCWPTRRSSSSSSPRPTRRIRPRQAGPPGRQARRHRQALRRHQRRGRGTDRRLQPSQGRAGRALPQPPLGRRLPDREKAARGRPLGRARHLRVPLRPLPPHPARKHLEGSRQPRQRPALRPRAAPRRPGARPLRHARNRSPPASARDRDQTDIEDAFDICLA